MTEGAGDVFAENPHGKFTWPHLIDAHVALALLYCHASHVLTLAVENNGGVGAALVDGQGGGNAPAFIVVGVVKKCYVFVAGVDLGPPPSFL